ncbi:threonine/serine exporter family protein, partial [Anaerotignum sp.]
FVYMLVLSYTESATTATLIATMAITATARFLSYHRQEPSILYQIPGVLSLVPGAAVYNTMQAAIKGNILSTYSNALTGFKLSGAIAIGSLIILVLPYKAFEIFPRFGKKKQGN